MELTDRIFISILLGAMLGLQFSNFYELRDQLNYHADIMQSISTSEDAIVETQEKILQALEDMKTVEVDVTAYAPTGKNTAAGAKAVPGWTAAVSRDMQHLLGKKIYIPKVGVREVTDLTAEGIERTIDVLVGKEKEAKVFGRKQAEVVVL